MFSTQKSVDPTQSADPVGEDVEKSNFSGKLVALLDPSGAAAEGYRMLRTNLFYTRIDTPPKVVALTSPGSGEGKSTTCANLGVVLAQAGKSTLILDCDLRKPTLQSMFGQNNMRGLVDILVEKKSPQEVWREPMPGLKMIPAGPPPPHPAELLSSRRFAEFLDQVRQEFDYVLMDTPPVMMTAESAVLAALADGVLLTLDSRSTRRRALRQTLHSLEGVGANVLGTVLNNASVSEGMSPYHGHVYGSK